MMHTTEHSAEDLIRGLEDVPASLKPQEFIGITPDYDAITPSDAMRYDACIPCDDRLRLPAEIAARNMPGGLYALFVYRGKVNNKQAVDDLWRWIYRRWAPDIGLKIRYTGAFERFPNYAGPLDRGSGEVQLFVPLKTQEAKKARAAKKLRSY